MLTDAHTPVSALQSPGRLPGVCGIWELLFRDVGDEKKPFRKLKMV